MFDRPSYIVREHIGFMKLTDTFDILDPENGGQAGIAQERISGFMKVLRLVISKQILPTRVVIVPGDDPAGQPAISIERGLPFSGKGIRICDGQGKPLGAFKTRFFSFGGAFDLTDPAGKLVARIKGDWRGKNYKFLDDAGAELGTITKQWGGLGKELFTSADTYAVALKSGSPVALMPLLLAASIAIDVLYHEQG